MATKTFEELKQLAIQIRDEKTNKQNTATRIGTQMLEHLNKLGQDYYDKTATDEELKQRDEKLSELSIKTFSYNTEDILIEIDTENGIVKSKSGKYYISKYEDVSSYISFQLDEDVQTSIVNPSGKLVPEAIYVLLWNIDDNRAYLAYYSQYKSISNNFYILGLGNLLNNGSNFYLFCSVLLNGKTLTVNYGDEISRIWAKLKTVGTYTVLPKPTDFNTVLERGAYPTLSQTTENGYTNVPSEFTNGKKGILVVEVNEPNETWGGTVVYQKLDIEGVGIYTRSYTVGGSFTEWLAYKPFDDIKTYVGKFTVISRPYDLNDVLTRGSYALQSQTSENGYTNVPNEFSVNRKGILLVYVNEEGEYPKGSIVYQLLIIDGYNICTRSYISGSWSAWAVYITYPEIHKNMLEERYKCRTPGIFHTIGVVADSLASGQGRINNMSTYKDFYEFSWPQCIARELGVNVYNFTKSGLTTRSWLTDDMGYTLMSDGEHDCVCYIIMLGANDVGLGESYLGSPSDIDLENYENNKDTYYGNYAKIISLIKKQVPRAKIFVAPNPSYGNAALRPSFNQAVKYMSTIFDNVYYLDIDESLYNNTGTFIKRNLVAGHYTPAAYQYIGSYIISLMADVIYENPEEFYFVNLIDTEYSDPQ